MAKILVTGGAGFIGSHVADAYIAAGHQVVIVDELSVGMKTNVNPGAKFYKADIRDLAAIKKIFTVEKPEIVCHHAAQTSVTESQKDPLSTYEVNTIGTINLAIQPGIKRFIFASTGGALYSAPKKWPATEREAPTPVSAYGISKYLAEEAIIRYAAINGFAFVILRYSNVYGPRQNAHGEAGVVAIFSDLSTKGKQPTIYNKDAIRDYVYVDDVVKANVLALTKGDGETINISTGIETNNQIVFETIQAAFNWSVAPNYESARPGEMARSVLDNRKAGQVLGWKPTVTFSEGVKLLRSYVS